MKRVVIACFRGMVCTVAVVVLWFCPPGVTAQTLINPGFESPYDSISDTNVSGEIANGWSDNTTWASGIDVVYSQETNSANVHGGASSQQIQVLAGFVQFSQPLIFQTGQTTASVWVKSESPMWVVLSLRLAPSPYTFYGFSPFVLLTNGWQQITVSGVTAAGDGILLLNSVGTGTFWVDDASLTFLGSVPATPQILSPTNAPIPAVYFGLHPNHLYDYPFLPWPDFSFGTVRSHDCAPFWAQIEPNPPVGGVHSYNWTNLDDFIITNAQAHGVQVIYSVYQTPSWASSTNALDPYGYPGGNGWPTNVADYSNFVHAAAARYQGKVVAYETWNEPDSPQFWLGTPAQMAALEQACAGAVRSVDTNALILAPPPGGGFYAYPLSWYDSYLAAGGGTNADVLPVHLYDTTPEQDIQHVAAFRSLVTSHGMGNKPVWNDESGWGLDDDNTPMSLTVEYLARAYVLDWAVGLPRFCWYLWDDGANVGVRTNSLGQWVVPTPGAIAYQQVENWLVGATMTACASDTNGIWTCQITRPNGYTGWIVWLPGQTNNFPLPAGVLRSRDLAGNVTSLAGETSISVNDTAVLLESNPAQLSASLSANQRCILQLQGLPAASYALETATNLLSPAVWTATVTNVTDSSGALAFTNSPVLPAAYFRCRYVF